MTEDPGKQEEQKFDFTFTGEVPGYISLDQARVLAIQHARDNTDFYGARFSGITFVWEVISQEETEDFYEIRLSFRPAGRYRGEPGIEQFTINKLNGVVEIRQVLDEPVSEDLPSVPEPSVPEPSFPEPLDANAPSATDEPEIVEPEPAETLPTKPLATEIAPTLEAGEASVTPDVLLPEDEGSADPAPAEAGTPAATGPDPTTASHETRSPPPHSQLPAQPRGRRFGPFVGGLVAVGVVIVALVAVFVLRGSDETVVPSQLETPTPAPTALPTQALTNTPVLATSIPDPTTAPQTTARATATPRPTATPIPAIGIAKRGGKVVMSAFADVRDWDPKGSSSLSSIQAVSQLYNQIVQYDTVDTGMVVCDLCQQWDLSGDGLRFTFRIRDGIKWQDGEDLLADDVVFSMR